MRNVIVWIVLIYLIGLSGCAKPRNDREYEYSARVNHSLIKLDMTPNEFKAIKALGMDSVKIEKTKISSSWGISGYTGNQVNTSDYVYAVIPVSHIKGFDKP